MMRFETLADLLDTAGCYVESASFSEMAAGDVVPGSPLEKELRRAALVELTRLSGECEGGYR